MRVEHTKMINRPVEDVFAFLIVPENVEQWMAAVTSTTRSGIGPVTHGETFQQAVKFLGRTFDVTFEVTELEPPRRWCVRNVGGPVELHGCFTLEPVDGQTRLVHTIEGEPGNLFRFADSIVERTARRQFDTDLATLEDVLQSLAPVHG
jgi:carbon monoxide dehydrogenase subunit G